MDDNGSNSIIAQLEALPPLPQTVAEVLRVISDGESSANDLVKAILPDQAMCIAVLKIANSAFYGRPKAVSSLETAVMVLGFTEVQNIVLAKAAVQVFQPILQAYRHDLDPFWDHSFTTGLAARIIGEHINLPSGRFFVAGLLHDIGKLAMLLAHGEAYTPKTWLNGITSVARHEEERRLFKVDHGLVGSRLLQRWQFPDTLVAALQYHHHPLPGDRLQGYPLVVQLADFLAHMLVLPQRPDEQTLKTALSDHLPEFERQWQATGLPWEEVTLESWFAWLKVDRDNGSAILDILAL